MSELLLIVTIFKFVFKQLKLAMSESSRSLYLELKRLKSNKTTW